jgi:hypothetical protein
MSLAQVFFSFERFEICGGLVLQKRAKKQQPLF